MKALGTESAMNAILPSCFRCGETYLEQVIFNYPLICEHIASSFSHCAGKTLDPPSSAETC